MINAIDRPVICLIADNEIIQNKLDSIAKSLNCVLNCFTNGIDFFENHNKSNTVCTVVNFDPIQNPNNLILTPKDNFKTVTSPFIFLSEKKNINTQIVSNAFKLGALDFIDYADIDDLLPSSLQEGMQLSILKRKQILESANASELLNLLSPKEQEVLSYLVKGYCHKKIAKILNISYRTVETHSSHIKLKTKLGMSELIYIVSPIFIR